MEDTLWLERFLDDEKFPNWTLPEIYRLIGPTIDITKYSLVIFGKRKNEKVFECFRVLHFTHFLRGAHTIEWRGKRITVRSILELKQKYFKFTDRAPFDIAAYLIHQHKLFRLKNIRIFIPQEHTELMKESVRKKMIQNCLEKIVYVHLQSRPEQQLNKCIPEVEKEVLLRLTELAINLDDSLLLETFEDF